MDPTLYIALAVVVMFLLGLVTFLKKSVAGRGEADVEGEDEGPRAAVRPRPVAVAAGARRRAGALNRLRDAHRRAGDESDEEENEELADLIAGQEGKVGAKKLKKLQDKAEKRAARESEERAREEKKKDEKLREEQRKKEEELEALEEAKREEEEKRLKEEQEKREHEEYLKLKEAFTVDEEGTHEEELNQDVESLLQDFINHIKQMKVVMLEDLAARFKLRTQDAVDRVQTLVEEGKLTGVIDDRGKFIYITEEEYEAVAKFIRQRGRVSITELVQSSNQLINLSPDNELIMKQVEQAVH